MIDPLYLYSLLGSFSLLFILGAIEKSRDAERFSGLLEDYQLLPRALVPVATAIVISAEAICAVLLVTPGFTWGVAIGVSLLLLYALVISINLLRGRIHIDCGCLGSVQGGISSGHVARNLTMAILLAICLLPVSDRPLTLLDYLVIPGFLAGAGLGYVALSLLLVHAVNSRTWWQS